MEVTKMTTPELIEELLFFERLLDWENFPRAEEMMRRDRTTILAERDRRNQDGLSGIEITQ